YDANDRLNGETYDANGNAVVSGGAAYAFDFENRISESGGGSVVVTYDGDGNRVAETAGGVTTRYLVDTNNPTGHAQVVEELDAAGQVARQYTYGHDLISQNQVVGGAWRVSFYGYDGQGSVRQLTDAAGAVTDTYAYDAFGNLIARTGSTPNSYLYTGEQFDANLGFYYLRARYLNTATGRFQSSDTFEGSVFEPLSLHKYTYVHNDPPNGVDPTGHFGDFSIGGLCTSMAIGATISAISGLNAHSTLESVATDLLTGAIEGALFYLGGGLILKSAASLFRYIRVVRSARALSAIEGVFSRIQNAGELFPGTEVPTRFTFSTRVGEFFISGAERGGQPVGAIKHVVELLTRGTASQTRMATALVLEDLEGAIVNASTQGITYGEKMIVGNWELIFEEAGVSGPLPKLFHAVYLGS
ncbi:MAG TPA: RHS repeat-associated core domain-containing protein, partial [Pyrinomonadaceae bacterium]|nr:RHS repeat-associated core domain-containing protein [Pyrinomonadaceae bacterium]